MGKGLIAVEEIKNKPKISILIPVYNVENYIEKCIESIKNQDFEDYEVIIVNDGSTDKSWEKVLQLTEDDNRYILINNQINRGIMAVRRDGYLMATGDYIIFLDSDDTLEPEALTIMYQSITDKKVDIVQFSYYYDYQKYKIKHKILEESFVNNKDNLIDQLLSSKINILLWGKIFNRKLFENNKFTCLLNHTDGDDLLLLSEILERTQSYSAIDIPVYNYLVRIDSISHKQSNVAKIEKYIDLLLLWHSKLKGKANEKLLNKYLFERINAILINDKCPDLIKEKTKQLPELFNIQDYQKSFGLIVGLYEFLIYSNKINLSVANYLKILNRKYKRIMKKYLS